MLTKCLLVEAISRISHSKATRWSLFHYVCKHWISANPLDPKRSVLIKELGDVFYKTKSSHL